MKTPWHLWAIGVIALLWNLGGVFDWLMTITNNEAYLSNFTEEQVAYYTSMPAWLMVVWTIAIWTGTLATVCLLLRKAIALPLFTVSFVVMIVSFAYGWFFADAPESTMAQHIATVAIIVIAILLLVYTRAMKRIGVLT